MNITAIKLSWFRGSASEVTLETSNRSVAVYGANGAGKSCFVDALEYALNDGKVQHLSHEYSGKHQEKGILNTHRPKDCNGQITIQFEDKSDLVITIAPSGTHIVSGIGKNRMATWDSRRTILRQDEVSGFVHSTKGAKYSVLLPLLGLGHLETTAENFRQLGAAINRQSGIKESQATLRAARAQLESVYRNSLPSSSSSALRALCAAYVTDTHDHSQAECLVRLDDAISLRLADATEAQRVQLAVEELAAIDIKRAAKDTRAAATALAESANDAVQLQIRVIEDAKAFVDKYPVSELLECPACGSQVNRAGMLQHLEGEIQRLQAAVEKYNTYKQQRDRLIKKAERAIALCSGEEIAKWCRAQDNPNLIQIVAAASTLTLDSEKFGESDIDNIQQLIGTAVVAAASAVAFLPPAAAELATAKERLLAVRSLLTAEIEDQKARTAEWLAERVREREIAAREQIHIQSQQVIAALSGDIQRMWKTLHPRDPIEDVRLRITEDTDKAVDISLKFYGKELESPRLTLSEGYRNSLGLCVFLAMAVRAEYEDIPIVLDDVIVSLDRAHRGMVVELLRGEFGKRQILLFTHDRDWYADLRQQLGQKQWAFRALIPYRGPADGIAWSHRTTTFDDARGFLTTRPDIAANEARKAMDLELAIHSERLGISLPYARGERNDRRTGHEFLERLIAEGKKNFQQKDAASGNYGRNDHAIVAFEAADALLVSWANRGSHSDDVVKPEAEKLIAACEAAIDHFMCTSCKRNVGFASATADDTAQCECGVLRWR